MLDRNDMPVHQKYPKEWLDKIRSTNRLIKKLEDRGIFLRLVGMPGSDRYRAFDAVSSPLGIGSLQELIEALAPELRAPTPKKGKETVPLDGTVKIDVSWGAGEELHTQ